MIKINDIDWDKASDEDKITFCKSLSDDAKMARLPKEIDWYVNYQYREGNHYTHYNETKKQIERIPKRKGEVRMQVNKFKSSLRAIQNYSTRFAPKWEIVPGDLDPDTITNARRSGKILDYLYRTLHLEIPIQGVVDSALNTSVAFVELDWNPKKAKKLGQVEVIEHDTFDIWLDPYAVLDEGKIKGQYLFKCLRKPVSQIKADKRYDKEKRQEVVGDEELSGSEMKTRIMNKEGIKNKDKIERALVYEFQLYDDEGNDKGGNVQLFTFCGEKVLRDKALDKTDFTIYCMQVPQDSKRIYHRPWMSDVVPLNKLLNRVISQRVMYVNQALIFRVLAEKGHGINKVTNEMGEFLEHNKGREVKQWVMHGLPGDIDMLESRANEYIEDQTGAHQAALGRMPTGARSGKVLESLQAADSNNLAGIRMSLESFLSILGSAVLDIVSEKYVTSRVAKLTEPEMENGKPINHLSVVGASASDEIKNDENAKHTIINKDNEVIVKIGSWLGHTIEAQRETLERLAELKVIPGDELLRQFEFPNVEDLSAKARDERLEQHKLDAEIAGRNQMQQQQPVPPEAEKETQELALADKENLEMVQGQQIPPTQGVGLEHTQAHADFAQTQDFKNEAAKNPALIQIMQAHIQGELQLQGIA